MDFGSHIPQLIRLQWSVLQYVIIRPAVSIAGIVCEALHILCQSSWSYKHPSVYLSAVDFVSIRYAHFGTCEIMVSDFCGQCCVIWIGEECFILVRLIIDGQIRSCSTAS